LNAATESQGILRETSKSSDHRHRRGDRCGRRLAGHGGEDEAAWRWFHQADRNDDRPDRVCIIVSGISGMGSAGRVARLSVKTMVYFYVVSALALLLGLIAANLIPTGARPCRSPE
jgi:hypothetical protein